jgi:hypothetical protein
MTPAEIKAKILEAHAQGILIAQTPPPAPLCYRSLDRHHCCAVGALLTPDQGIELDKKIQAEALAYRVDELVRHGHFPIPLPPEVVPALRQIQLAHDNWSGTSLPATEAHFLKLVNAL